MKFNLGDVTNDLRRNLTVNSFVNNDTKHLSKLLSSERGVWHAINSLAYEQSEASKCMTVWGRSEDVDLCDVTEKLSILTTKLSESAGVLAEKYVQYRTHLKEIRGREEKMKEQRNKKEILWGKIEKEERKHKRTEALDQKLKDLHKEMENLQKETIEEETALADFKRKKLQAALLVQLDALFEFGEKLIILTKYSKDIVEQIPITDTHPGEPRASYHGQEKTSQVVSDAIKALEEWTPPLPEKFPAYLQRSQVTMSEDSQEESLTNTHPGYVITQQLQNTHNIENKEFSFATYKQKTFPATSSTSTENMTSSNAKYYEDPNEADHSDLDQTTDADQEPETPKKFREVATHLTEESISENTMTVPFHTIQIEGAPRPPTPPISHVKSVSFEERESPESTQVTQSEDQETTSSHIVAPSSTLDTSTEIQISQSPNPAQNEPSASSAKISEPSAEITEPSAEVSEPSAEITEPSAEVSEPSAEITEPSIEVSEPPIGISEISNIPPQNEIKQPTVYLSSKTHTAHNHQKHVHFSDVEDEIP